MRRLVIETATEALSLALFDGDRCLAAFDETVGRGHAERLIPAIADLPDGGRADVIWVDCGPGSFTGVRIGIAAARALGFAWSARLAGFGMTALVAAGEASAEPFAVVMEGGHGEWLVANAVAGTLSDPVAMPVDEAARTVTAHRLIGNRAADLAAARGYGDAVWVLPRARDALALPPAALTDAVAPHYARAPDARPNPQVKRA